MKTLKDKQLVSSQQHNLLDHNFGDVSMCLFENKLENSQFKDHHSYCYNLETKHLVMTLHYYSPEAYEFVHNVFFLPHSSTILSWAASVDCEYRFYVMQPYMPDVVVIVDAMELHKGTWWDQKKRCCVGRVDYGTALPEAGDNITTKVHLFKLS